MSNRLVDVTEQAEAIAYGDQAAGLRAWQPSATDGPISPTRYPKCYPNEGECVIMAIHGVSYGTRASVYVAKARLEAALTAKSKEDR
jgi:hypothetical protein